jgi:hypothetical protein
MNNKSTSLLKNNINQLQVRATVVILAIACILPMLIHIIPPVHGTPIGALLLPMFYIPFIAIIFFRLHVGVVAAVFAPIINLLITGSPLWHTMLILSFELLIFTLISYLLLKDNFKWIAAPLSFVFTKIISSCLLMLIPLMVSPIDYFFNSISNGTPGIIILGIINLGALGFSKIK